MLKIRYISFLMIGLLFFINILSMQEPRSATPLKARAPSTTLTLEENLGLHIRFSSLENKIDYLEERMREYSPNVEQLTVDLENAHKIISSNNEVIDSLHHYQVSVNEIMPFFEKVIISHPELFSNTEMSRFTQIMETIINAEADCKKKIYGE